MSEGEQQKSHQGIGGFLGKIKKALTYPRASITVHTSKDVYAMGEDVEGILQLVSDEEFDIEQVKVNFKCIEKVERRRLKSHGDSEGEEEEEIYWDEEEHEAKHLEISGPMHMSPGVKDFPFSVNIPIGRPETHRSIDRTVEWSVQGEVNVKGRLGLNSKRCEVPVVKTLPQAVQAPQVVREVIREVVMIPCRYCGTLMAQTMAKCPKCDAPRGS